MTRLTVPSYTIEGLKQTIDKLGKDVKDLQRRGEWKFDEEQPEAGAGVPFIIVAASDAPQAWKDAAGDYVCDGTDDDITVQNAATSFGGGSAYLHGRVLLSPGVFYFGSSGVATSEVSYIGQGIGSTFIYVDGVDAFTLSGSAGSVEGVYLYENGIGSRGVVAQTSLGGGATVRDCFFYGFTGSVRFAPGDGGAVDACRFIECPTGVVVDADDVSVLGSHFEPGTSTDGTGIASLNGSDGLIVTSCRFTNFGPSSGSTGACIDLDGASGFAITGNAFLSSPDYTVLRADTTDGGRFSGNHIESLFAISITTAAGLVVSNNSSETGATGTSSISVGGTSNDVSLLGNVIGGTTSTLTIGASVARSVVADNFLHPGASGYTDSGTGTMKPTNGNYSNGGLW